MFAAKRLDLSRSYDSELPPREFTERLRSEIASDLPLSWVWSSRPLAGYVWDDGFRISWNFTGQFSVHGTVREKGGVTVIRVSFWRAISLFVIFSLITTITIFLALSTISGLTALAVASFWLASCVILAWWHIRTGHWVLDEVERIILRNGAGASPAPNEGR